MKIMQNVLNHWCYETLKVAKRKEQELSPEKLDVLSKELREDLASAGLKPLSEYTCREIIVEYASKEFPELLGLYRRQSEFTDKFIKKVRKSMKD